jgi:hypothetical protein
MGFSKMQHFVNILLLSNIYAHIILLSQLKILFLTIKHTFSTLSTLSFSSFCTLSLNFLTLSILLYYLNILYSLQLLERFLTLSYIDYDLFLMLS